MSVADDLLNPDLSPEAGAALQTQAGMLICLDVPPGTQLGLDYADWTVGARFRAVSLLPPGIHFMWFSAAGKLGEFAPRCGFFFSSGPGDVIVCRWDGRSETLLQHFELPTADVDAIRDAAKRHEFDSGLGPYPLKTLSTWQSLTASCTPGTIVRVCGSGASLMSTAMTVHTTPGALPLSPTPTPAEAGTAVDGSPEVSKSSSLAAEAAALDELCAGEAAGLVFTKIRGVGRGSAPPDVTRFAIDTSFALADALTKLSPAELCGELQLAFIAFVQGQQLQAFEHWRGLVIALCCCEDALLPHVSRAKTEFKLSAAFFVRAYRCLAAQLSIMPADLFEDELSRRHFLLHCFQCLHDILGSRPRMAPVPRAIDALLRIGGERFGWAPPPVEEEEEGEEDEEGVDGEEERDSDDEDGPVVVDLTATML